MLNFILVKIGISQTTPLILRCASVNSSGNITLTWDPPAVSIAIFTGYEIYHSATAGGTFSLIATITGVGSFTQTTYVHAISAGTVQSQYYYIASTYVAPTPSIPSDTLRSVFLNLSNPGGQAILTWNATHTPLLPTASTSYTLERENPATIWTTIYSGTNLNFNDDSISKCSIIYNYKITTSDALGCISQSNIDGDLFQDNTSPDIPILDSVSVNNLGQAQLGWEPAIAPDTKGYQIYQFTASIWTLTATVMGRLTTSYTNPSSIAKTVSEKYCILAFDSCNNLGLQGLVNNTDQNTILLNTDYDLCSRTANLTWNAYSHLQNGFLQYDVYCSINGATPNLIATVAGLSYNHSSLNPNDTYCYFIRVRNNGKTISAISNQECELAKAPTGPSFVYVKSVSVNLNKQIEVSYTIDNSRVYKGATIFKSLDGIAFSQIGYQAYSTATLQTFTDPDVKTLEKNYFYKIQISDSCGNPGQISNTSKSIVLHVSNNNENIFYNSLIWDDYTTWLGGVSSYNIYRAVNGVFDPTPIVNLAFPIQEYIDDVQDFASEKGKFSYYIEAVEGAGNLFGFIDKATSNPADAYVEAEVFVPNAFMPRGINKVWMPIAQYVEKTDYKVIVFDRWGTKVFETTSDTQGWDGNHTMCDTFIYLIEYKNSRGEHIQLKGHLNLIR